MIILFFVMYFVSLNIITELKMVAQYTVRTQLSGMSYFYHLFDNPRITANHYI